MGENGNHTSTTAGAAAAAVALLDDQQLFADVLCAVDGTPESLLAVEQAAWLAGPGAHLTVLVVTAHRHEADRRSPAIGPAATKRILDSAAERAERAGAHVALEVDPAGPPAQVVLEWAAGRSMLAIGAPSTSWFSGLFSGGVAVHAESTLPTPMLIARATAPRDGERPRMLLASDGMAGSDELVDLGGRLARAREAHVTLLHAAGGHLAARSRRLDAQHARLEQVLPWGAEVRVQHGAARTVIVECAGELHTALIVMSSRRLHGVRAVGSVSRRVVHQGHCSVLLVPPETHFPG
jgi:nucleotide-binding universal stress UspA family protein